jgi:hypothetical protein
MKLILENWRKYINESEEVDPEVTSVPTHKKYPRTFHLPWSLSRTEDDKTLSQEAVDQMFAGKEVVVTEKLDGENTTIYSDGYCHARSVDSRHHPSRSVVKALAASVACDLPAGWRLMGENLYAKHSIEYNKLPSYFILFAIADENNQSLSWNDVEEYAELLELNTAPVIYRGLWNEDAIKALWPFPSSFGGHSEGYVVRTVSGFSIENFPNHVAKFVRSGHVQTKKHWMHTQVVPNILGLGGSDETPI